MAASSIDLYYEHRDAFVASVLDFFDGDEEKLAVGARMGSIKLIDGLVLRELIRESGAKNVLEVGSFIGFSTRWILAATDAAGARVTALDPGIPHRLFADTIGHVRKYCGDYSDRLQQKRAYLPPVRFQEIAREIHAKALEPGTPEEIEARLREIPIVDEPFDTFDFAFVDGDHNYDATVANVGLVARMMAPGSTIVVHDAVTWPDVEPALTDLARASNGALELVEITGAALYEDMVPYFEQRMTPANARHACNSFSNGMAVLRVHKTPGPLRPKPSWRQLAHKA